MSFVLGMIAGLLIAAGVVTFGTRRWRMYPGSPEIPDDLKRLIERSRTGLWREP